MFRPPNLASKPSTFHSGRYDESSSSRKSSGSAIELQEMHHGHQLNKNLTSPLIEQPEEEMKISRMTNRSGTDFVRDMQRQVSIPIIILGIATVALLVVLLSILTGPNTQMVGYRVSDYYISPGGHIYSVALKPINQLITVPLHGISKTLTLLPNLNMSIQCYGLNHLRVSIRDMDNQRWEIPEEYPYSYATGSEVCDYRDLDVVFDIHQKPFSFKIIRKSTNEPLLNTEDFPLVFSKYYMELTTRMPSYDFYGFGERSDRLQMTKGSYTIFPKDQFAVMENGEPGNNLYGQQPVYLMREASGNYHIVMLRNSNAMEIQIGDDQTLKYQVVGGVFDFQIFLGSKDPEPVVEAYHKYIGKWTMPPFWSLGFHQSKWGYNNLDALNNVMQAYQDYQIPLDVIWSDIDYMVSYLPFTVDPINFPPEDLKASLTKFGKKWVPIVDAGVGTSGIAENFAYRRGKQMDVFLKNKSGKYYEGWVWSNRTVFPDFFHPQAEEYWLEMLHELDNKVPFDGIWLDMNEIATFCNGTCNRTSKATPFYDTIPFLPGNISLENKSTDLEAVHYGNIKEFDAHSLFNLLQQEATYSYLKTKTPLPFILTRANIFGSGQFASHWFGDPSSEWIEMRNSIAGVLRYNLFGMPHNGADICGYAGTPTPELCTRWTQLGVFYTFARNHHEKKTGNQEPFIFEERYRVPMTQAIRFRYSILKHFYTLFVSKGGLGTLIKPLFFEFPDDQRLLRLQNINGVKYVEEQFMVGKSMMVAPVLYPAMDVVDVYFPENACWYNLLTYELVNNFGGDRIKSVFAPMSTMIPVFIRGGWVIMMQDSSTVMSTKDLNNVFSMVIALPETGQFNVQGSSAGSFTTATYTHNAKGEILDIVDYEEVTVYTQCILDEEDCVLRINVEFAWNVVDNKFRAVVQVNRRTPAVVQVNSGGNVTANEIKILGDMIKILDTSGGLGTVSVMNSQDVNEVITVSQAQIVNDALIIGVNSSSGGGILLSEGSKYVIEN